MLFFFLFVPYFLIVIQCCSLVCTQQNNTLFCICSVYWIVFVPQKLTEINASSIERSTCSHSLSVHAATLPLPPTCLLPFFFYPPDALELSSFLHHLTAPLNYAPVFTFVFCSEAASPRPPPYLHIFPQSATDHLYQPSSFVPCWIVKYSCLLDSCLFSLWMFVCLDGSFWFCMVAETQCTSRKYMQISKTQAKYLH